MKGVNFIVRKFYELVDERVTRLAYTGSNIRVTQSSFPDLHGTFLTVCRTLDMQYIPELYIGWDYSLNAEAFGVERPAVKVNSGCVDLLSPSELMFFLGHELGHVKSGHMLYGAVAAQIGNLTAIIGEATMGLGRILTGGLEAAFFYWYRMSELTADRAGLLACQDGDAALTAMVKMAGLPIKFFDRISTASFIQQAREFEGFDSDSVNWVTKLMITSYRTHPWTVMRAKELLEWVDGGSYDSVVRRETRLSPSDMASSTRTPHVGGSASLQEAMSGHAAKHQSVVESLRQAMLGYTGEKMFITPTIPHDKLTNATSSYAQCFQEEVLFLYDATVFGGGKHGLCLTRTALFWKNIGEDPHWIWLADISTISAREARGFLDSPKAIVNGSEIATGDFETAQYLSRIILAAKDRATAG